MKDLFFLQSGLALRQGPLVWAAKLTPLPHTEPLIRTAIGQQVDTLICPARFHITLAMDILH